MVNGYSLKRNYELVIRIDEKNVMFRRIPRLKIDLMMLGIFPKVFYQAEISKGISPSGNFPNVQFPKRQLSKYDLAAALGPQSCSSRSA